MLRSIVTINSTWTFSILDYCKTFDSTYLSEKKTKGEGACAYNNIYSTVEKVKLSPERDTKDAIFTESTDGWGYKYLQPPSKDVR